MANIHYDNNFKEILVEELREQLHDGYPCSVSKDMIIKDIVDIVIISMVKWKEQQAENNNNNE